MVGRMFTDKGKVSCPERGTCASMCHLRQDILADHFELRAAKGDLYVWRVVCHTTIV